MLRLILRHALDSIGECWDYFRLKTKNDNVIKLIYWKVIHYLSTYTGESRDMKIQEI